MAIGAGVGGGWTVERVRELLPDVPVKIGEMTYNGIVVGRGLDFPTVYCLEHGQGREFAWETIVYALNHDTTLLLR